MRVISRGPFREFARRHPDARGPLDAWFTIMAEARYETPHELQETFLSASFLGAGRTVFNIGGNKYRLIVDIRDDLGLIYARSVLTHEEYDRRSSKGTL